jgi:hypothetical protein
VPVTVAVDRAESVMVSVMFTLNVATPVAMSHPSTGSTCWPDGVAVLPVGPTNLQLKVYPGVPPVPVAMNRHDTLPVAPAMHGVPSTLKDPLRPGMLVVAVEVVAVDVVVVVAGAVVVVVDVVAIEDVVTGVGEVLLLPPPQPAPVRAIAAISATRRCACNANLLLVVGAITVPSRARWRVL